MILEENKKYLSEELILKIEKKSKEENSRVKIEISKTGLKTGKVKMENGVFIYIHSQYDPEKEAFKFWEQHENIEDFEIVFIMGFGFGYHVKEALKRIKDNQQIIIFEPNFDLFSKVVEEVDVSNILSDKRLSIITDDDNTNLFLKLKKITEISSEKTKIIIHPASLKIIKEENINIKDVFERIDIDRKSWNYQKNIIKQNSEENMKYIEESEPVKKYFDKFKNKPVFVIASGPSLSKNIKELIKVKDKGMIISVGSALKPLMQNGIKPDFVIVIDSHETVYNQIGDFINEKLKLIYFPIITSKILKEYKGIKICAFPEEDLYFEKIDSEKKVGFLKSGGSVATAAIDFAKKCGGNPIIFVGQDLAIEYNGKTHADNSTKGEERIDVTNLRMVEGNNGKKVYTLKNLYFYLRWIEWYISVNSENLFINATEGGAFIKGSLKMKLSEAIDKFCL